ncbi:helix-turn-helix domain-containing protein [Sinorhizobium meliloti]|uniref:helix-turn-helix domain-containing protein n=1 Tax=Rhizobium meliloti TaxID=382 RepID=UPI000FDB6E26|nr:helix-turn-helix domain-containing protein [Sinorhizobium meliloti]RVN58486.1 DNA-binding protein [Sinorhizobium meliloti]
MLIDENTPEKANEVPLLPDGRTPEEVARHFGVSPRRIRQMARELGACRIFGNKMFLLPADIEAILEASKPKPRAAPYRPGGDYEELLKRLGRMKKEAPPKTSKKSRTPSRGRDTAELLQLRERMKREEAARKKK